MSERADLEGDHPPEQAATEDVPEGGRRQLEDEIAYRDLFNSVSDGVFQTDLEGNLTKVNTAFASMFGTTPEEILEGNTRIWQEAVSEEGFERIREGLRERGGLRNEMLPFTTQDGSERWISVTLNQRKDEKGETVGYDGIAIDDTERIRYKKRLEALHANASRLSGAATLDEIAELTFDTIEQILGFTLGAFSVVEGGHLREIHKRGDKDNTLIDLPLEGRGISVRAVRTGEAQLVPDVSEDDDYIPGSVDRRYRAHSELDVPVKVAGEVVAVINVESVKKNAFTSDDCSLVETLAGHVATNIQKIRLLESERQHKAKIETLHRHASELASAMTIEEVAESTLKAIEHVLGFPLSDFNVVEGDTIYPIHIKGINMGPHQRLRLDGPGIVVRAVNTGESQLVPDTRRDEDYLPVHYEEGKQTLSELSVPVIVDAKVEAVLNVESSRVEAITADDQKLIETLAWHVSSAIGRLKKTEQLRESEKKFRTLLDKSSDGVLIVVGTTIVYANETIARMLGHDHPSGMVGRQIMDVMIPDHREMVKTRALGRQRGERHPEQYETTMLRADGTEIAVENFVKLVEYEGRPASYAFIRDITNRKKMEEELMKYTMQLEEMVEERTEELQKAERMATIGELAAMVGHDLRNPLTSISGAVYFLRTNCESKDDTAEKMFEIIENDVEYSNKIIKDLLDYSKTMDPELSAANPRQLVRESLSATRPPENVRIRDLTRGEPRMTVDAQMMKRVFVNLINNAIDAMPSGGELTIESRDLGGEVEFLLSDTGVGIPEDIQEKIWEPLFTTKAKGMGLGLSICKRMVEAHGGTISIRTKENEGTTFIIKLPLKK